MSAVKNWKVVPSAVLGGIHGGIRMLDEGFAVRTVLRIDADAEAATNAERNDLGSPFSAVSPSISRCAATRGIR